MRNSRNTHFWRQPTDQDRRSFALVLAKNSSILHNIRLQCMVKLSKMSDAFLAGVRTSIRILLDSSCVEFPRLIVSQSALKCARSDWWRDLLAWMIKG